MLDIFSSPQAEEFVKSLREECDRVLKAHDGRWTKDAVNDLIRIDSAIRESMRHSDLAALGVVRMVSDIYEDTLIACSKLLT